MTHTGTLPTKAAYYTAPLRYFRCGCGSRGIVEGWATFQMCGACGDILTLTTIERDADEVANLLNHNDLTVIMEAEAQIRYNDWKVEQ